MLWRAVPCRLRARRRRPPPRVPQARPQTLLNNKLHQLTFVMISAAPMRAAPMRAARQQLPKAALTARQASFSAVGAFARPRAGGRHSAHCECSTCGASRPSAATAPGLAPAGRSSAEAAPPHSAYCSCSTCGARSARRPFPTTAAPALAPCGGAVVSQAQPQPPCQHAGGACGCAAVGPTAAAIGAEPGATRGVGPTSAALASMELPWAGS